MYTELIKVKGWEMTPDKKFVLVYHEKGYYYWHEVMPGKEKAEGYHMGDYSYDYCFRHDSVRSLKVLNEILNKLRRKL